MLGPAPHRDESADPIRDLTIPAALAGALLIAPLAAAQAGASPAAGPSPTLPPPVAQQRGPELLLTLRARDALPLARGSTACAAVAIGDSPPRRGVCVVGGRTRSVRVRVGDVVRTLANVPVERLGPRAVRVAVSDELLRLSPGDSVTITTTVRGRAGAQVSGPTGLAWRTWRLVGCSARGAGAVRRGPRGTREVGLSYDDGPGPYTGPILNLLAAARAQATFYMTGYLVPGQGALVRRVLREGHVPANHSWEHALLPGSGSIGRTQRAIRDASGFTPCSFRPPDGVYSTRLGARARAQGMRSILWSIDTNDWRLGGSGRIAAAALAARGGDIILMHDGGGPRAQTVAATRVILDGLRRRGLRPVSVEQLLGFTPLYRHGG